MNCLSVSDKMSLMKVEVLDLRNADYRRMQDIANMKGIVQDKKIPSVIKMKTSDLARIVYNTHMKLLENSKNLMCVIDTDTICRIINEVNEKAKSVSGRESSACVFSQEDGVLALEEKVAALNKQIIELKKENDFLRLTQKQILPEDNSAKAGKDDFAQVEILKLKEKADSAERKAERIQLLNEELQRHIIKLHDALLNKQED